MRSESEMQPMLYRNHVLIRRQDAVWLIGLLAKIKFDTAEQEDHANAIATALADQIINSRELAPATTSR